MSVVSANDLYLTVRHFFSQFRATILIATSTVTAVWFINKLRVKDRSSMSHQSMEGKTVLITGANTGVGYEVVKVLLQRGARVIVACRNLNKGQQAMSKLLVEVDANQSNLRLMECDLCSLESVRNFAKLYNREEERLDVLICNARISWLKPIMTRDGFHAVVQVNYLGHFLLTNLLLEKLKQSRPSRIINVSSELHDSIESINWSDVFTQFQNPHWHGAYPSSKLFQILSAYKMKQDLFDHGVDVFALTPGWMSISHNKSSPVGIRWILRMLSYPISHTMKYLLGSTPKNGALTIVYCAVEPTLQQSKDMYFANCRAAPLSSLAVDLNSAERLWKLSVEAVGLS